MLCHQGSDARERYNVDDVTPFTVMQWGKRKKRKKEKKKKKHLKN